MSCPASVFFTTIHFKEALYVSTEWKAAEILLLGDFLQRHKVLREIGLEFNIMQSTHCAKNPDKKLLAHHTRDACGAAGLKLKGGRFVPPLFETV